MQLENKTKLIYIDNLLDGMESEGSITAASIVGFEKYACGLARFVSLAKKRRFRKRDESTFKILERFKNDPGIYVSYIGTIPDMKDPVGGKDPKDVPKLGINPKSHYNTPLGIYTYPLAEIWENIEENGNLSSVPYQGEKPYIAVLRVKPESKFVNDMYSDYDSSDYDGDLQKLISYFVPNILSLEQFNSFTDQAVKYSRDKNPISTIWNVARYLSFMVVKIKEGEDIDKVVDDVINSSSGIDYMIPEKEKGKLNPYALTFNRILNSVLGYDGFADKSGRGYIHKSEPTQAVFLNPRSYDVIHILENTNSEESDVANERRTNRMKLEQYLEDNIRNIKVEDWERILYYHPDLLIRCPNPEPLMNKKVQDNVDSYWEKKFDVENIDYINSKLPHLSMLPKTKKSIYNSWKEYLNQNPHKFNRDANDIPEFVLNDKDIREAVLSGWKSYILHDPYTWESCPYDEIKYDPKTVDMIKKFFISKIDYRITNYEMVPEELKNDPQILEAAKSSIMERMIEDENALVWIGINYDLRHYLLEDEDVFEALKEVWAKNIHKKPSLLTKLPSDLDYDRYYQIAKTGLKDIFENKNVEDIFSRFSEDIPEDLIEDPEIMALSKNKWTKRLYQDDFDIIDLHRVPVFVLSDIEFWNKSYDFIRNKIIENPQLIPHDIPAAYKESVSKDASLWTDLLTSDDYGDLELSRLYRLCTIYDVKNIDVVKDKATRVWKSLLLDNFGNYMPTVPKELQRRIADDPELKEEYYKWLKNRVKDNPIGFNYNDAGTEIQKKAYKDGFTEFLMERPLAWGELNKVVIEDILKDDKVREKLFNVFKFMAKSDYFLVSNNKMNSPFGDEIYKDPEVIEAIKENIKEQIMNPDKKEIETPMPELINQVKLGMGDNEKTDHYIQLIIKNSENVWYYLDKLSSEEREVVSSSVIEHFKDHLRETGTITKELPKWVMPEIYIDDSMRDVVFNAWYRFIEEHNIGSLYSLNDGSESYGLTPPKYVITHPEIIYIRQVNSWCDFLEANKGMLDINKSIENIPAEYKNHPKLKAIIDSILNKGGNELNTVKSPPIEDPALNEQSGETANTNQEDNLSYSKVISERTVWSSYFNDNIIVNF